MKILFIYKRDIPIDDETNFDVLRFPKKIVDRMNKAEIEYVLEKCEVYKKIEKNPDFKSFWDHVKVLAACHLDRLIRYEMRKKGSINIQSVVGEEYSQEVESAFKDKTFKDLIALEEQAKKLLNSTEFVVDVEFWEQMLSKIAVQKAVMQLEELYVKHLHTKQVEAKPTENDNAKDLLRDDIFEDTQTSDPLSPKLYRGDPFKSSIKVYKEDEYTKRIEKVRQQSYDTELKVLIKLAEKEIENRKNKDLLMEENNEISDVEEEEALDLDEEDKQLRAIMRKEDSKDPEDEFAFEDLEVSKKNYEWIDRFKPRKPHYFNRVKMGYEWTKVNQAHYDLETPPPKQVLGYKFNIFYPNLIHKHETPRYELEPSECLEFCILRFMSGPPYEELAFKIVNKQWDLSDRQGFKCIFDRGILHLHFNFIKARYRR